MADFLVGQNSSFFYFLLDLMYTLVSDGTSITVSNMPLQCIGLWVLSFRVSSFVC